MITLRHFRIASWKTNCGCKIYPDDDKTLRMEYCPTHAAAPTLAEALTALVGTQDHKNPDLVEVFEKARAVLREFEQGK